MDVGAGRGHPKGTVYDFRTLVRTGGETVWEEISSYLRRGKGDPDAAGATEFQVPAKLDDHVAAECARVAVAAHQALGLRDLSRSDLIIDDDGEVWFLEVNVAPGLTETSTVPLSVQAAGLDLGHLMADLVHQATTRGDA